MEDKREADWNRLIWLLETQLDPHMRTREMAQWALELALRLRNEES